LVLGYAPSNSFAAYKMYDGFSGSLTEWEVSLQDDCPHCAGIVASGDPVWK